MTIRRLLFLTLAVAILLSAALWNWGISLLVAVMWGLGSVLRFLHYRSRPWLARRSMDLVSCAVIYFFSVGPAVGLVDAIYGYESYPDWLYSSVRVAYAPHVYLASEPISRNGGDSIAQAIRLSLIAYIEQWQDFGMSVHLVGRKLLGLF